MCFVTHFSCCLVVSSRSAPTMAAELAVSCSDFAFAPDESLLVGLSGSPLTLLSSSAGKVVGVSSSPSSSRDTLESLNLPPLNSRCTITWNQLPLHMSDIQFESDSSSLDDSADSWTSSLSMTDFTSSPDYQYPAIYDASTIHWSDTDSPLSDELSSSRDQVVSPVTSPSDFSQEVPPTFLWSLTVCRSSRQPFRCQRR